MDNNTQAIIAAHTLSEKNKQTVLRFQMAVAEHLQGNPQPQIADYLSDSAKWHLPYSLNESAIGSTKQGKTEILELFDDIVKRFYDPKTMSFDFYGVLAGEDKVHLHFTLAATTTKGKRYQSGYQILFRIEQDKIAEVWEYFDSAALFDACA